ncbi:exodeoxyribonuclease VII small subunit [Alphaproteobacteria bacterium]|nr:exodeoxyribonuclease VII small subunit [Alphaproteobacteria bacterium]
MSSDINKLSFEESLSELELIINQLEEGKVTLEESIEIYSRGEKLRNHCEKKLRLAKEKIEKIIPSDAGDISSKLADIE